jgi:hypothetical protein
MHPFASACIRHHRLGNRPTGTSVAAKIVIAACANSEFEPFVRKR